MRLLPGEIERESFSVIRAELRARGVSLPAENEAVILRCIHASADFDYAETLTFTPDAVRLAVQALQTGVDIVTDTNMALAGVSKAGLNQLGGAAYCFMADDIVAQTAKKEGTTRAVAAMNIASQYYPGAFYAVGNAPTALLRISERIENGLRPALVIGVPVGFVNVEESKERALSVCSRFGVPAIVARGRKGGSSIAAAICNALIYTAAGMLDPEERNQESGKAAKPAAAEHRPQQQIEKRYCSPAGKSKRENG